MEANEKNAETEPSTLCRALKLVGRLRQELADFKQERTETMGAFKRVGNALKTANMEVFHYKHLLQQTQQKLDTVYDEHVTTASYADLEDKYRLLQDTYNHQVNVSEIRYQTVHREWRDKCTKLEQENSRLKVGHNSLKAMLEERAASQEAPKPQKRTKRKRSCNKTVIKPVHTEEYAELELAVSVEREKYQHLEKELLTTRTERDGWKSKARSLKRSAAEKEINRLKSEHEEKLKDLERRIEETVAGRLLERSLSHGKDTMVEAKNGPNTTEPKEHDDLPKKYVELLEENKRLQKLLEAQQSTDTKPETKATRLPNLNFCEAPSIPILDVKPNQANNEESDASSTDVFTILKAETLFTTCLRLVSPMPDSDTEQVDTPIEAAIATSPPDEVIFSKSEAEALEGRSWGQRVVLLEKQVIALRKADQRRSTKSAAKTTKRRTMLKNFAKRLFLVDQAPWSRLHQMQLRALHFSNRRRRRRPPRSGRGNLRPWCTEANLSYPSDDSDNETIETRTVRKRRLKKRKPERKVEVAVPMPEPPASPELSEQTLGSVDSGFPRSVSESEMKVAKKNASEDSEGGSKKTKYADSVSSQEIGRDAKEVEKNVAPSQSEKLSCKMSEIFGSDSEVESSKSISVLVVESPEHTESEKGNNLITTIDPPEDMDCHGFDHNGSHLVSAYEIFRDHLELLQRTANEASANLKKDLCLSDDSTCSNKMETPTTATDPSLSLLIEDGRKKLTCTVVPSVCPPLLLPVQNSKVNLVKAVNVDKRITILSNVVVQEAPHPDRHQLDKPKPVEAEESVWEDRPVRKRIAHQPLPEKATVVKQRTPVTSDSETSSPRRFSKRIHNHQLTKLSPVNEPKIPRKIGRPRKHQDDESLKEKLVQTTITDLNPCVIPTRLDSPPINQPKMRRKVGRPRKHQNESCKNNLEPTNITDLNPPPARLLNGMASPPRDCLRNFDGSDLISRGLPGFDCSGRSIGLACESTAFESPASPPMGPCDLEPAPLPIIIPLTNEVQRLKLHKPTEKDKAMVELLMACPGQPDTEQRVAAALAQVDLKAIVRLVLERLTCTMKSKPERYRRRRAPNLTKTEQVLLGLLLRMNEVGAPNVIGEFLEQAEARIVKMKHPIHFAPVARLHAAVCKYLYLCQRMRLMLCTALTYMGDMAVPYLYIVLNSWLDLMLKKEMAEERCSVHERLLIRTIVQVINTKHCVEVGYNLLNLRRLLLLYYGYSNDPENTTELLEELFKTHAVSGDLYTATAITMLVKNMKIRQVLAEVNDCLKPLANAPDANPRFVIDLVRKITALYDQKHTNKIQEEIDRNKAWIKLLSDDDSPKPVWTV